MRILVAQTSFLGDVVLSTPVFAALKQHYPEAHLTALVRPESAGILEGHPDVDAVMTDDKRGHDRGLGSLRVLRKLRDGRFDLAVALHKSFRTAWLLAAAGIGRRVGFRQSAGWFLYHRRVRRAAARHDVERNLSILAGLDIDPDTAVTRPFVACSPAAAARVGAVLGARGINPDAPLIGVAPGSAWATKRWTAEGYAALATALQHECGATSMLLGGGGDVEYAAAVERAAGAAVVNLAGRTDLAMLVAAIDRCRVLVSNDSAPMHIAVARRVPVVAIFGPTVPGQGYGPYSERAVVVQRELPCRPCSRHGGPRCPIGTHACMREIRHTEVQRAVVELLQRYANEPRRVAAHP
jgi:heptosyltransferase-2